MPTIKDKHQPREAVIYASKHICSNAKGRKRLKVALSRGRRSIKSLRPLFDDDKALYNAAESFTIKQTYLEGEWYWELYKSEHKGFNVKPLSDL